MRRRLEIFLWVSAACGILIYVSTRVEESSSQAYLNWKFAEALELPAPAPGVDQIRPYPPKPPNQLSPSLAQPLGRLEIPSIELSAMFVEGVDSRSLRRAVGHIPGTALPGRSGNVVLSGHRDTFFRRLGRIHAGDVIWLTTLDGRHKYIAESSGVIDSDEAVVLRDIGRPTLTLVTCYPFYYVGSAPKRFVVHASLATPSQ